VQVNHRPYCVGIEGGSGCGKTTFLARLLLSPRTPATCRFIFDHVGALTARLGKRAAFTLDGLKAQLPTGWVIFNPSREFTDDVEAADWFARFAMVASDALPGRKIFAIDELQDLAETSATKNLKLVFNRGRNVGLDVAYITQSFAEVDRTLTKQTKEAVTFKVECEGAHHWLRKRGFNVAAVLALPLGHYIARNLVTGGMASGRVF